MKPIVRLSREPVIVSGLAEVIAATNNWMADNEAQKKKTGGLLGPGSDPYGKKADGVNVPFREFTDEVPVIEAYSVGFAADDHQAGLDKANSEAKVAPKCRGALTDWAEKNGAAEQSAFIAKIAILVYGVPTWSTSDEMGKSRVVAGQNAAAAERAFYPTSSTWCVSEEVADTFWKINSGYREIEAWADNRAGSPGFMLSLQSYFNNWREVSHAWKTGHRRMTDLRGLSLELSAVRNIVYEYGYPGAFHDDRRSQDYTKPTYGGINYISTPDAEMQSDALKAAQKVKDAADAAAKPSNWWDLFRQLPWWAQLASGVAVVGLVGPPIANAVTSTGKLAGLLGRSVSREGKS